MVLCPFRKARLFARCSWGRARALQPLQWAQQRQPMSLPRRGTLWPSLGRHITLHQHVGLLPASLGPHSEQPNMCPEGSQFSCPVRSSRLSNPAGIRHRDVGRAAGHSPVSCQHRGAPGPAPAPESCGERVPTGAKSEYQRHESCPNSSGFAELN